MNAGRWDDGFIQSELQNVQANNITRIWVCGPPAMNETFERFFAVNKTNWLQDQ